MMHATEASEEDKKWGGGAKWCTHCENLINIMIICAQKWSYMHVHGGAAHVAMETNLGLPTYRPITLCRQALTCHYYYWLLHYM